MSIDTTRARALLQMERSHKTEFPSSKHGWRYAPVEGSSAFREAMRPRGGDWLIYLLLAGCFVAVGLFGGL